MKQRKQIRNMLFRKIEAPMKTIFSRQLDSYTEETILDRLTFFLGENHSYALLELRDYLKS